MVATMFNGLKKRVIMRNSLSLWFMALAVFGAVSVVNVPDARSETFWERYFGGSDEEEKAKPKHVFLQPENGRSSKAETSKIATKNMKEVNKKLREVEKNSQKMQQGETPEELSREDKRLNDNIAKAQRTSQLYEAAKKKMEQFDGKDYEKMTADEQREYGIVYKELKTAEKDLNRYMDKIDSAKP